MNAWRVLVTGAIVMTIESFGVFASVAGAIWVRASCLLELGNLGPLPPGSGDFKLSFLYKHFSDANLYRALGQVEKVITRTSLRDFTALRLEL